MKKYDFITKKLLTKEYTRKSIRQIAKKIGCSYRAIRDRLIKYNISIKTRNEAIKGKNEGINNGNFGKKHPGLNKGVKRPYVSELNKKRIGNKNPMFGKSPKHGKRIKYKDIWMRSSWETKFAKYLDRNNIRWLYEFKTFNLIDKSYTPDFYLSNTDEYIEIKGWWRNKDKKRFNLFRKLYPKVKIRVLKYEDLKLKKILK